MVDITVKVLEPADDFALVALEDAKIMLGISSSDTASDQQLQMQIEQNSMSIARICNRVFAKEKVRETHRLAADQYYPDSIYRVFLTHYPVKEADIESVESPKGTALLSASYEIEEHSGKLTLAGADGEVVVTYTGGYDLPDESPLPLQQALATMVRETKQAAATAELSGIRMISHKDARVMFHSPTSGSSSTTRSGTTSSGSQQALDRLLQHYTRLEV